MAFGSTDALKATAWVLFLDDLREPDYVSDSRNCAATLRVARSSAEAIRLIEEHGLPDHIWFDHDLGGEDTAVILVNWLIEQDLDQKIELSNLSFTIHSSNPVGRENISGKLGQYIAWKRGQ